MNLGDGLMFQLEDGKPKLVLSTYGAPSKSSKRIVTRTRPQNVLLKSKQVSEELVSAQAQRAREKIAESRKRVIPEMAAVTQEEKAGPKAPGKTAPRATANGTAREAVKAPARARTPRKADRNRPMPARGATKAPEVDTLKGGLVCLTQDQLQQILSTISRSPGSSPQEQAAVSPPKPGEETKEDSPTSGAATEGSVDTLLAKLDGLSDERTTMNGMTSGLFSSLGEREREKETLEAKRAQWKKELDEQMALKQQQKKSPEVSVDCNAWGRPAGGDSRRAGQVGEERASRIASVLEERARSTAQSSSSQQDLPAAIRSAFVLGLIPDQKPPNSKPRQQLPKKQEEALSRTREAAPAEDPFSAQRQEQQRRWLQELEQQREEAKLRRLHEKQELSQAEDHERWAMHFDSLQKRAPSQLPAALERGEPASHQLSPSGALSVVSEGMSTFGGDSPGRVSVDTTRGAAPRASYLRTMTSLLDPAQIEERERKRLKQLEHQRAIQAQVEERRCQREREEALRREEEREEEQRVARERDLLQEQYQLDALRERQRKELQSRKTEELYLSVQRAQQEALKDKQEQRIRKLARKGHDISKLLNCLETEAESPTPRVSESRDRGSLMEGDVGREEAVPCPQGTLSSRRDAAVQTEVGKPSQGVAVGTVAAVAGRAVHTPDISAEYRPQGNGKRPRNTTGGKENMCLGAGQGSLLGMGEDPYEPFARQQRPGGGRGGGKKRPEWNTHRPSKAFVPASERYPQGQRRDRQESRLRRQMELLTLVERNAPGRPGDTEPQPQNPPQGRKAPPHRTDKHTPGSPPHCRAGHVENRGCSPPVPAVKHRLQQQAQEPDRPPSQELMEMEERPPSSPFIPYVRTDEVYQLDPLAPLSRPPTQGSQQPAQPGAEHGHPIPPASERDPLLHPELLKNKERQQAILRGLSELRQGLLKKQRELETGLNPLLLVQQGTLSPHFQHM